MRGSTLTVGVWGRRESKITGGRGGFTFPPVRERPGGSALTIGGFPTHVTLHEGDDPNSRCQEAISEPGKEGLEGGRKWENQHQFKRYLRLGQTEGLPIIPPPHPAPNSHVLEALPNPTSKTLSPKICNT